VPHLVNQLPHDSENRESLIEELYTITGFGFGHDPEVWIYAKPIDYSQVIKTWLDRYSSGYEDGILYKFGFPQDLTEIY
jgi:hypothetical protein